MFKVTRKRVEKLIKYYSRIPEEKWCTGDFHDWRGRSCALGHILAPYGGKGPFKGSAEMQGRIAELIFSRHGMVITMVNDGAIMDSTNWRASTPRGRILKALRYILKQVKEKQYGK